MRCFVSLKYIMSQLKKQGYKNVFASCPNHHNNVNTAQNKKLCSHITFGLDPFKAASTASSQACMAFWNGATATTHIKLLSHFHGLCPFREDDMVGSIMYDYQPSPLASGRCNAASGVLPTSAQLLALCLHYSCFCLCSLSLKHVPLSLSKPACLRTHSFLFCSVSTVSSFTLPVEYG